MLVAALQSLGALTVRHKGARCAENVLADAVRPWSGISSEPMSKPALLLLALAGAIPAHAQTFEAGYDYWDYDVEGFVDNNGEVLDFQDDLTVEAREHSGLRLRWDSGPG